MSGVDPQTAAQWAEARRWFAKAAEDLCIAGLAMAADPPLLDPAAYHCQQAAEKLFKGLLVSVAVTVPKTHDLERLSATLVPLFPGLAADIEGLATLTPWCTATRYPDLDADLGLTAGDIGDAMVGLRRLQAAIGALDPARNSG